MRADRLLIILATLRVTTKEVTELRRFLNDHTTKEIIRALNEIDDQLEGGVITIRSVYEPSSAGLVSEIESIIRDSAKNKLNLSITDFLSVIIKFADGEGIKLPIFDTKKGLHRWLLQCINVISPSELLRYVTIATNYADKDEKSWRLR